MQHQQEPSAPGWHADPTDPNRQRYWDGRWTKQTRTGPNAPDADTQSRSPVDGTADTFADEPPRPARNRSRPDRGTIRRVLVAALVILLLGAIGGAIWFATRRGDAPDPKDDQLDGLVYEFASPRVPCCASERNEGTSQFTVEGAWRVEWELDGTGSQCSVVGRIVNPSTNRYADLEPFGSGASGTQEYTVPGTYSISLLYSCPDESVAMAQVRVFEDGV